MRGSVILSVLLFACCCSDQNKNPMHGDESLKREPARTTEQKSGEIWFLAPQEAAILVREGGKLLDARFYGLYLLSHVSGARSIHWKDFSVDGTGLLQSIEDIRTKLEKRGFHRDDMMLVYGGARDGWGEEGRIAWMLRSAGYANSYIVDGGYEALHPFLGRTSGPIQGEPQLAGSALSSDQISKQKAPDERLSVSIEQVKSGMNSEVVILDTREKREFAGSTPYGEDRGGHIPGAVHLYFLDFMQESGFILDREAVIELLRKRIHGFDDSNDSAARVEERTYITYCTGGVRSAFAAAVLRHYGINAYNYPGSMWEWSSQNPADYPLETSGP